MMLGLNKSGVLWSLQVALVAAVTVGALYRFNYTREILTGNTGFFTGITRFIFG